MHPSPWRLSPNAGFAALGLAAALAAQEATRPADAPWQRARAVWFVQAANPVGAEVDVGGELLPWDDAAQKAFDACKPGDLLPLGRTGWAALDTFNELDTGAGKVKPGTYALGLERTKTGWQLLVFDAGKVRAAQTPPSGRPKDKPLAMLALKPADGTGDAVRWRVDGNDKGKATIALALGPHALTATVDVAGARGGQPNATADERGCAHTALGPAKDGKQPLAVLDYGKAPWTEEHRKAAAELKTGKRWRLGTNWWTTLDANAPFVLGGRKVAAGCYHMAIEKGDKDRWQLVLGDADADDKAMLDAYGADYLPARIAVPMSAEKAPATATALKIEFASDAGGTALVITYGETRLTTKVGT
jgi:hypothetical protein